MDAELSRAWNRLEQEIIIFCMGCFTESRGGRFRDIVGADTLQELKGIRWVSMLEDMRKSANNEGAKGRTKQDFENVRPVGDRLGAQRK